MQSQFNRAFRCPSGTQHLDPSRASLSHLCHLGGGFRWGGGGLGGTKREERAALAVAITMKVRARLMVQ